MHMLTNWKTTVSGVLAIVLTIATSQGWVDANVAHAITTILVALGLVAAQDANKPTV